MTSLFSTGLFTHPLTVLYFFGCFGIVAFLATLYLSVSRPSVTRVRNALLVYQGDMMCQVFNERFDSAPRTS